MCFNKILRKLGDHLIIKLINLISYLERELYIWISRSSRGNEKKIIFCWTGSGMRLYFSSTFWKGSFSATILAEMSSKESGVFFLVSLVCTWFVIWFVESSLILNVSIEQWTARIFVFSRERLIYSFWNANLVNQESSNCYRFILRRKFSTLVEYSYF